MAVSSLKYKTSSSFLTAPAEIDLGAMIPIATTTLSSTTTTITFSSIPQNYEHLQIRGIARIDGGGTAGSLRVNFNGDTAGANYYHQWVYSDGASAINDGSTYGVILNLAGAGATASVFGAFVIDVFNYTDTNKTKVTRAVGGIDNNGSGYSGLSSTIWNSTNAISSVSLFGSIASLVQYTSFTLYGIKKAGA